jgi:hypothetical protein
VDDEPEPGVKSIVLQESDRELISLAAPLLMAQEPGQSRQDGAELLVQNYREDLADAHPGVDPAALEEMALNFCMMKRSRSGGNSYTVVVTDV